jgi:hypothetical protein
MKSALCGVDRIVRTVHSHERPAVTTRLEKELKRELDIEGALYTLTLAPSGFKLAAKGKRKGQEIAWRDLVSGEAALAVALNASLARARE